MFCNGKYDVYLSTITLKEIQKCPEPKQSQLVDYLNQIQFITLEITEDVTKIAEKMIELGILTQKSFDDCQHIGAAIANGRNPPEGHQWVVFHRVCLRGVCLRSDEQS